MIFQQLLGPFPEICLDFIYIPSTERFECSDHGIFDLNMSHLILCLVRWTAYCIVSKFAWQLVGMYYFAIDRLQIWGRKSCQFTIEKFLSSNFKTTAAVRWWQKEEKTFGRPTSFSFILPGWRWWLLIEWSTAKVAKDHLRQFLIQNMERQLIHKCKTCLPALALPWSLISKSVVNVLVGFWTRDHN